MLAGGTLPAPPWGGVTPGTPKDMLEGGRLDEAFLVAPSWGDGVTVAPDSPLPSHPPPCPLVPPPCAIKHLTMGCCVCWGR